MGFAYITNEQLQGFDGYKYSSRDTSPLSNYVMHPFWNATVKLFPRWIAPNILTLVGFLFLVSQTIVFAHFDPTFQAGGVSSTMPKWVWFYGAFAHFMAHTLDGIDGKQARRTGSSGPLGELFDHGLDAWSTSLFVINVFSVAGELFTKNEQYIILWLSMFNFMCSHWEKYNTGLLYLPWAYDVSMVSFFALYIISGCIGTTFTSQTLFGGYNIISLFKITFFIGTVVSVLMCVKNVIDVWRKGTCKQKNLYESFRPWVPLFLGAIFMTSWTYKLTNYDILGQETRIVFLLSGIVFANIACRLVVVQMSNTRAEVLSPLFIPVLAGIATTALLLPNVYLAKIVWFITFFLCLIMHIHYGFGVVHALANYLNIRVFKIVPITTNSI